MKTTITIILGIIALGLTTCTDSYSLYSEHEARYYSDEPEYPYSYPSGYEENRINITVKDNDKENHHHQKKVKMNGQEHIRY